MLPLLCSSTEQARGISSPAPPVCRMSSFGVVGGQVCRVLNFSLTLLVKIFPSISSAKNSIPCKKWQAHGTLHYQQQNHDNQQQKQYTLKWTSTVNANINTQTIHTQPPTTLITHRRMPTSTIKGLIQKHVNVLQSSRSRELTVSASHSGLPPCNRK